MNKTSIEWCDYTWNPVTGCFHPCRNVYCYNTVKKTAPLNRFGAKYRDSNGAFVYEKNWKSRGSGDVHIAQPGEIYPYGYDPTFYPHRLEQPSKMRTPQKIFTVDTGDLFGKWVPHLWIDSVLDIVNQCPWHTFIFLTKNPERFNEFAFPKNAWIGTTVNSDKDIQRAETLRDVKAPVRFLSIEPLLGAVTFSFEQFKWIIVGAQTGAKPVIPEKQWVDDILSVARMHDIPIFIKGNLKPYYPSTMQQFPK